MFFFCLTSTYIKTDDGKNELDRLLSAIANGDQTALARLYTLTSSAVYSFALSILRNEEEAKDVLQDCFVTIFHRANLYQKRGNPLAWIFTIAKNLCLQVLREQKKTADTPLEELAFTLAAPEEIPYEDKIVLEGCMNALSDTERQIVILHAVWGFKHREIARILDLALPTVLSKYNRSIKKLQKILLELGCK